MPATPVDATSAPNAQFCKTKLCKFYMEGRCTRNSACKFAHGAAELEPLPNLYCTKMCPALSKAGRCDRGAACTFAHKSSELRGRRRGMASKVPAQDAMICIPPTSAAPACTQPLVPTQCILTGVSLVLLQVTPQCVAPQGHGNVDVDSGLSDAEHGNADVDSDLSDADLDFLSCDKPSGGWSRQTTEEGFEESSGEFSRQTSEESTWGLQEVEETRQEEAPASEAFSSCGWIVKNTFLQFDDRELPLPVMRRVSSTGSCMLRGL